MRVLVTTNPAYGHFLPMLPLMNAARSAGHEVVVATGADLAPKSVGTASRVWAVGPTWAEAGREQAQRRRADDVRADAPRRPDPVRPSGHRPGPRTDAARRSLATRRGGPRTPRGRRLGGGCGQRRAGRRPRLRHPRAVPGRPGRSDLRRHGARARHAQPDRGAVHRPVRRSVPADPPAARRASRSPTSGRSGPRSARSIRATRCPPRCAICRTRRRSI